MPLETVSAVGG